MPASRKFTLRPGSEFDIHVPASIANLGPGFDTLAVAVDLYLHLSVHVEPGNDELRFHFVNAKLDGENYIERAFRFVAAQRGGSFPSLSVTVHTEIPAKSGLGSSAAATVAGLRLYEAIAGHLPPQGLLNAACALEHHPDNVAAALLGGLTISCQLPDRSVVAVSRSWPESLRFLVLTPEFPLPTIESRKALPEKIAREDAVFNLQRVSLLLHGIQTGDFSLLREALHDRVHQPYRQALVPGLERLLALDYPDLLGVCLSGAGPSIVAFAQHNLDEVERLLADAYASTNLSFRIRTLSAHQNAEAVLTPIGVCDKLYVR